MINTISILHLSIYFIVSIYYAILDYKKIPKCNYSNKYPTIERYVKVIPYVSINLAINVILIENIDYIINNIYNDHNYNSILYLLGLAISIICTDIWFYILHITMHYNRFLYRHIHKTHHIYAEPFAFSAFDSNIIEHFIINIGSIIIGPCISGYLGLFSKNCTIIFILYTTYSSCIAHSGYSIKHFLHHKNINCNYGQGIYLLDKIFGTYKTNFE